VPQTEWYSVTDIPDWVKCEDVNQVTGISSKELSDGVIFLVSENEANFIYDEFFTRQVIKITSHLGLQNNSTIRIDFSPNFETVMIHRVSVIREGKIVPTPMIDRLKAVTLDVESQPHVYTGQKTLRIHFDDARAGDILEYCYTTRGRNPVFPERIFMHMLTGFAVPVAKMHQRIVLPKGRDAEIKYYGMSKTFERTETPEAILYEYQNENVDKVHFEDHLPIWYEPYPYYILSEFHDWKEVATWATSLFALTREQEEECQGMMGDWISSDADPEEKTRTALRFVQNEISYLSDSRGIYGFKPHPPAETLRNRYGDCKDKSLLLCILLKAIGVEAVPALVNTRLRKKIKEKMPSPLLFSHCVVRIRIGGKEKWVDPTIYGQGGNLWSTGFPAFQAGLPLESVPEGIVDIDDRYDFSVRVEETMRLESPGESAVLESRTDFRGSQADIRRFQFAKKSMADIEKYYQEFFSRYYGEILKGPEIRIEEDTNENRFTVFEKYLLKNPWRDHKDNQNITIVDVHFHSMKNVFPFLSVRNRIHPFGVPSRVDIEHTMKLFLNRELKHSEVHKNIDESDVKFTLDASINANIVDYKATLHTGTVEWKEAGEAETYARTLEKINTETDYFLSLAKNPVFNRPRPRRSLGYVFPAIAISVFITVIRSCVPKDYVDTPRRIGSVQQMIQPQGMGSSRRLLIISNGVIDPNSLP
jgi:hypothetical protein